METAEQLLAGGRHGPAVLPGKSGESPLVQYLTGELKPQMPPGKPLSPESIALIRRWIDEGAKIDGMVAPLPTGRRGAQSGLSLSPRRPVSPSPPLQRAPVTALAYSPDGKLLAVGGYRAVRLLDGVTGALARELSGPSDQVLSLAWSADGKWLAAAGGVAGAFGELCVWSTTGFDTPRCRQVGSDTLTGVAWRPVHVEIATAGLDKTVTIWNAATLTPLRTLKDHVDPVMAVAYSADGAWLATGSVDRTVKLYRTEGYAHVGTIPSHGDAVTALAFSPKGDHIVTACADRKVRVWPVAEGAIVNPLRDRTEEEVVQALAFSADGRVLIWGGASRKVRVWDGEVENQQRELTDAPDWVYAVAASPDGKTIAAGAADGKVYLWQAADGKLAHALPLGPGAGTKP
jgi:WD40 repeat protein